MTDVEAGTSLHFQDVAEGQVLASLIGCGAEAFYIDKAAHTQNTEPIAVTYHRNAVRKTQRRFHCRYAERLSFSVRHDHVRLISVPQRVSKARRYINTTRPLTSTSSPTCLSALGMPEERRRQAHCLVAQLRRQEGFSAERCSNHSSQLLLHPACSAPAQQHSRLVAFSAQPSSNRNKTLGTAFLVERLGKTNSSSSNRNRNKTQVCGARRKTNKYSSSSPNNSNSSLATAYSVPRCNLRQA